MLKARICTWNNVEVCSFDGDYLIIEDEYGDKWRITWDHNEGDYIRVDAIGKNTDLIVRPRSGNRIEIT